MGFASTYKNLEQLPEVKELKEMFLKRGYTLCYCNNNGLRMQKKFTEIHFIPETDRLRLCIHDDGMGEKETDVALEKAGEIVMRHGYRQGSDIVHIRHSGMIECEDEYYKYFE